jgi:hypothetical protein
MANDDNIQNRFPSDKNTRQVMARKAIDGNALRVAAQAQAEADAANPVTMNASLLDIVTAFEPMIRARKDAKWTDAEICAWLAELGYEIDRQTLRAYRSQLGILAREPARKGSANTITRASIPSSANSQSPSQTAINMLDASSTDTPQAVRPMTKVAPGKAITADDLDDGV